MSSDIQPVKDASRRDIKKAANIKYSCNFNLELSRLLGMFSFFQSNNRLYRALWNLYQAVLHIQKDRQQRMFMVDGKLDGELLERFNAVVEDFKKALWDNAGS